MVRVVVTGSEGNLGRKACTALRGLHGVAVTGIDRTAPAETLNVPGGDGHPVVADLDSYDPVWTSSFAGADVVLHLAAEPRPVASWDDVRRANVDRSLNVLRAVEEHAVPRFVFASSNWVVGGHRFDRVRLTPTTTPFPVNPYGYSKAAVERVCAAHHARVGTHVLVMRIGYCQPAPNRPGPHMAFGRWGQEMWLGDDDWNQAVVGACTAPWTGFEVVNVISSNAGMRWDLSDTERVLGYRPMSQHRPRLTLRRRMEDRAAMVRARWIAPFTEARSTGARW